MSFSEAVDECIKKQTHDIIEISENLRIPFQYIKEIADKNGYPKSSLYICKGDHLSLHLKWEHFIMTYYRSDNYHFITCCREGVEFVKESTSSDIDIKWYLLECWSCVLRMKELENEKAKQLAEKEEADKKRKRNTEPFKKAQFLRVLQYVEKSIPSGYLSSHYFQADFAGPPLYSPCLFLHPVCYVFDFVDGKVHKSMHYGKAICPVSNLQMHLLPNGDWDSIAVMEPELREFQQKSISSVVQELQNN